MIIPWVDEDFRLRVCCRSTHAACRIFS